MITLTIETEYQRMSSDRTFKKYDFGASLLLSKKKKAAQHHSPLANGIDNVPYW